MLVPPISHAHVASYRPGISNFLNVALRIQLFWCYLSPPTLIRACCTREQLRINTTDEIFSVARISICHVCSGRSDGPRGTHRRTVHDHCRARRYRVGSSAGGHRGHRCAARDRVSAMDDRGFVGDGRGWPRLSLAGCSPDQRRARTQGICALDLFGPDLRHSGRLSRRARSGAGEGCVAGASRQGSATVASPTTRDPRPGKSSSTPLTESGRLARSGPASALLTSARSRADSLRRESECREASSPARDQRFRSPP